MNINQWRAFLCKLGTLFFLQGYIKSTGVLIEDTVNHFESEVYLVGLSFSLVNGLSNFLAPLVSKLMDYVPHRYLVIIGGILSSSGFIIQGFFAKLMWQLFVCNTISGVGFALISLPTTVSIANNFEKPSLYATVMGVNSLISNIGMAVLPILVERWREQYGLLWSVALLGALLLNDVPISLLFPTHSQIPIAKRTGKDKVRRTTASEEKEVRKQRSLLISHPTLTTFYVTRLISILLNSSWAMFLVPVASQKGLDQSVAVYLSSVGGVGVIVGKLIAVFMFYFGKLSSLSVLIPPVISIPAMFIMYVLLEDFAPLALTTFAAAFGMGVLSTWSYGYLKTACCKSHFKEAASWASTVSGIGAISAGITSGLVYNIRGQYGDVFISLAILSSVSMATMVATIVFTTPDQECDL